MTQAETLCLKRWTLCCFLAVTHGGLGPHVSKERLFEKLYGKPCSCQGGTVAVLPSAQRRHPSMQQVNCGSKTAYLIFPRSGTGGYKKGTWYCLNHPRTSPADSRPGPCECESVLEAVHSTCLSSVHTCVDEKTNQTVYTATLTETSPGTLGGDWSVVPRVSGSSCKYAQAPCKPDTKGGKVCWSKTPPVHVSDGGGPQDQARQHRAQKKLEELARNTDYHPLALPKTESSDTDTQTFKILETAFKLLNDSSPSLAQDCWLCLHTGVPRPLAVQTPNIANIPYHNNSCPISLPIRAQPLFQTSPLCVFAPSRNDSHDVDLGAVSLLACARTVHVSRSLCAGNSSVFVCGDSLAYTFLPANWTGLCAPAILLPDVDVIPGDEPVPVPRPDVIAGRRKRAVRLIPWLAVLGITGAVAAGSARRGISTTQDTKLPGQLMEDVQLVSGTLLDVQGQVNSLAGAVLRHRRGLDSLTAEHGGACLALQERCCFYANKSGIVRDKIKKLQEDLQKRRKELAGQPWWSGLSGLRPLLLPLGSLFGLLILLSLAPILFNKIMAFLKQRLDAVKMQPIRVRYHRPDTADRDEGSDRCSQTDAAKRPDPRPCYLVSTF